MISNQWYAILESNEVKPGHPVAVKRMGERLVLRRNTRGEVACMRDLCPHRRVALRRVRYWVTDRMSISRLSVRYHWSLPAYPVWWLKNTSVPFSEGMGRTSEQMRQSS
jgi:phenylpropionate dioxygenase-like ring-hydroxylating dioxygenase large terminal subunit